MTPRDPDDTDYEALAEDKAISRGHGLNAEDDYADAVMADVEDR